MLKCVFMLVAVLAAGTVIVPASAQASDSSAQHTPASSGDRFVGQNWTAANATHTANGPFSGQQSASTYALASPTGNARSVMLAGVQPDEPYALDGRFRNGQMYTDRFGANNNDNTDKYAHKALRLSNGDVVMIGLVPKLGATGNPAYGVGYNIGMVRYDAAGVKQKWVNPLAEYTDASKSYFVYPNKDVFSEDGSFWSVGDVMEYDGWIYILAKAYASDTDHTFDVRVVRIRIAGTYQPKSTSLFTSAATSEWGVGMNTYNDYEFTRLYVVVGRNVSAGAYQTWVASYIMGANGALVVDSTFGTNGTRNITPAGCVSCAPRAVAGGSFPSLGYTYIAGDYDRGNGDHDAYVMRLESDGTPDTYRLGFRPIHFPAVATPQATIARDVVVGRKQGSSYQDDIYVLAAVGTDCGTTSAGIANFDEYGYSYYWSQSDGKLLFGGGEAASIGPCSDTYSLTPYAMALNGYRLAIVGYSTIHSDFVPPDYPSDVGGPSFNVVRIYDRSVRDSRVLRPTGVDIGPNGGDGASAFFSVVVDDNDSFYAVGRAKDAANHQRNVPMTARVRADLIFRNGLE